MQPKRVAVRLYVVVTAAAGIAAAVFAFRYLGRAQAPMIVFFYAVHLLALTSAVEVPIGGKASLARPIRPVTLSPGFIVLLTAVFIGRPSVAVVVALIPSIPLSKLREPVDLARLVFNSSQEALSFAAAGAVFSLIRPVIHGVPGLFASAIAAAVAASIVNVFLVAGVVALDRDMGLGVVLRRMAWTVSHSLSFALAALLVSTLFRALGPGAVLFLFMPLAALRFVRRSKIELDEAHERTIREFVHAVERKDPYTRNHSARVAEIVVAIHRELGTPEVDLQQRYLAALLHDVGKVVVRSEVLRKPGPLTPEEYDEVKRHVSVGADAVSKVELLSHLADEVRLHHERIDGRGYPFGLRGDEIPRNVRILSVADCFEAMTSARVYRAPLSVADATRELRSVAGAQLDDEPVEALVRVLESGIVFANPTSDDVYGLAAVGEVSS